MAASKLPPTGRGYNAYEVVSAYQKAIRRSDVDGALYWGAELYRTFPHWAWKRLTIIVSEDIGPAAPGLPADVRALKGTADDGRKKDSKPSSGLMYFVHATILAARAPKSRICDWALFAVASESSPRRDVPDEAHDMHTLKGKQMGRGAAHFVKEAGKLIQPQDQGIWADGVAHDLVKLEKCYYDEGFGADQTRWRDRMEDYEDGEPETGKPTKPKQERQERMLPE